ncbi:MAG TPA: sulfatase-like hydrolase/transferase [Clostridia bacterium]|nr:sulfatase-like hydrolase/transferase [Clostridia bacterium]
MDKPNIVFLFTDQHNYSLMGNENDPYVCTPNLDKLSEEGTKFTRSYTNCPVCAPARMSLLSGQLPLDHGCLTNQGTLDANIPTYAHSMNIGGYQTVLAGRMHIYGTDQYRGNEVRLTGDNTPLYTGYNNLVPNLGEDMKFTILQKREGIDKAGGGYSLVQEYDNAVTNDALEFLDNRQDKRPLIMTVGFFSPHPPFIADVEKYKKYYKIIDDPEIDEEFEKNLHPAIKEWKRRRNVESVTKEDWRRVRAAYYANVEFLDENIGKVIDKAKEELGENTIFIYSSDHGDSIGVNNMIWKTTFFDSSVRIPMIFSGPGIQKGRTVDGLVCLNDITRTLIEYGGGPELPRPYGISLKSILENNEEVPEGRSIISQIGTYGKNKEDLDLPSAMIIKGDYKLISYFGYERTSLYNMKDDKICSHDLFYDKKQNKKRIELENELDKYWDGEKALELSLNALDNFKVMKEWANITKFPLMGKFYNGLNDEITPNWSMDSKDNRVEVQ